MGAPSGSAFLASVTIMDRLGMTISWFPFHVGELEVLLKLGLGGFNLSVATVVLTSHGMEFSLPLRITSLGVQKMRAPLRVVSVSISFGSTVWHTPKVSRITGTSYVKSWSIIRIASWIIFGTNQLLNNFYGKFLLVV